MAAAGIENPNPELLVRQRRSLRPVHLSSGGNSLSYARVAIVRLSARKVEDEADILIWPARAVD